MKKNIRTNVTNGILPFNLGFSPLNLIPFYRYISHGTRTEYAEPSRSTAENRECGAAAGFVGSLGFALGSFERENGDGAGGSWTTWRAAQEK